MGLRTPFGYSGYETTFLNTIIYLLDRLCAGCHNDEDFGDCHSCPAGQLIYASKDYLNKITARGYDKKQDKMIAEIQKELKDIEPTCCFNVTWIMQEEKTPDILRNLRELASKMEFHTEDQLQHFRVEMGLRHKIEARMIAEYEAAKGKKVRIPKFTKKEAKTFEPKTKKGKD